MIIESAEGSKTLCSLMAFEPGDVLSEFRISALLPGPTRHSVQCSTSGHMLMDPGFLQFMNHSCDPNVVLQTREMHIRAIRPVAPGDEIVYFYPSTEWAMAEPFRCSCKSPRCLIHIRGAAYLPPNVLAKYYFCDHIATLLAKRQEASTPKSSRMPLVVGSDA
jgi:hypothetical protein